jgi:D-specific alpha-keto acid dehydrogenase
MAFGAPRGAAAALPSTGITIFGCAADEAALFRQLAPRFGIRPKITQEPLSALNIGLACGHRCISVDHKTRVTAPLLSELSQVGVRYLATRSIGYDHIDVECAQALGIRVENVTYSPDSVADYTLMLILMAIRHAKAVFSRATDHDYTLHEERGKELRDLTVGVIGTGRIGAAVLERLSGFGCRVLAYDTRPKTPARYVSVDELLRRSDIVTLHTPLTPDTFHLLDRRRIAQMKQGSLVVNTGRGPLLDTEALITALETGHLGGAALDVLEGEEGIFYADRRTMAFDHKSLLRLQALSNVLISPHTAYYTDHALNDLVEKTLTNCLRFQKESKPWIAWTA